MEVVLSDEDLQRVYSWVDEIPLSRSKRNITRDFSDGGASACAAAARGTISCAGAVTTLWAARLRFLTPRPPPAPQCSLRK